MADGVRATRKAAEKAVAEFLNAKAPWVQSFRLIEDGEDGWAFWIEDEDTTSYVHHDLGIEWYGTSCRKTISSSPHLSTALGEKK